MIFWWWPRGGASAREYTNESQALLLQMAREQSEREFEAYYQEQKEKASQSALQPDPIPDRHLPLLDTRRHSSRKF